MNFSHLFALDVNSDALAAAVITFAFDTSSVNGDVQTFSKKSASAGVDLNALRDRFAQ